MEKKSNNKIWAKEYGLQQQEKTISPISNKYNQFQKQQPFHMGREPVLMNYASSILQTAFQDSKINQQIVYEVSDLIYPQPATIQTYRSLQEEALIQKNAKTSRQKYYFSQEMLNKLKKMVQIMQKLKCQQYHPKSTTFINGVSQTFNKDEIQKYAFTKLKNSYNLSKTSLFHNYYNGPAFKKQAHQKRKVNQQMKKSLQQLSGFLVFKLLMIQSQVFKAISSYNAAKQIYFSKNQKGIQKSNIKIYDSHYLKSEQKINNKNTNIVETLNFLRSKSKIRQQIQPQIHHKQSSKIQDYQSIYQTPNTKKVIHFNDTMKKKKKQLSQTLTTNTKKSSSIVSEYQCNSLHSKNTFHKFSDKDLWEQNQNQLPTIKNIQRVSLQNSIIRPSFIILQPQQQKRRYLIVRTNLYQFHLTNDIGQDNFSRNQGMKKIYKQNSDLIMEEQPDTSTDFQPFQLKANCFLKGQKPYKQSRKVLDYDSEYVKIQRKTQKKQKKLIQQYYFQQKQYPQTQKKKQIIPQSTQEKQHKYYELQNKVAKNQFAQIKQQKQNDEMRKSRLFKGKRNLNLNMHLKKQPGFAYDQLRNDSTISNTSIQRKINSMPKVSFNTLRPTHLLKQKSIIKNNNQIVEFRTAANEYFRYQQKGYKDRPSSRQNNLIPSQNGHYQSYQNRTPEKQFIPHGYNNIQIGPSSPRVQYYSRPLSPNQNTLINKFFDERPTNSFVTPQKSFMSPPQNNLFAPYSDKIIKHPGININYGHGQQINNNYANRSKLLSQVSKNVFQPSQSELSRRSQFLMALQSKNSQIQQVRNDSNLKSPSVSRPKSMSAKIFVTLRNQKILN